MFLASKWGKEQLTTICYRECSATKRLAICFHSWLQADLREAEGEVRRQGAELRERERECGEREREAEEGTRRAREAEERTDSLEPRLRAAERETKVGTISISNLGEI